MRTSVIRMGLLLCCVSSACASASPSSASPPASAAEPADAAPADAGPAPTFTALFTQFFAPGTPGHCATSGCHADPGHNEWLCGTTKESCYQGMVQVGHIDPARPQESMIADPARSPLTWINPAGGNMPFDAQGENPAGLAAIRSWVAAGALDN